MLRKYPTLYKNPHIEDPSEDPHLPFSEYIRKWKKIIANFRADLNPYPELIINANAPFELGTSVKKGILLIHGLLDSPFLMKDIANNFQDQEVLIRAIVLPGHSTVPGALLDVTYEQWLKAVRYGIESLKKEVDQIYLIGFSTGASLSIYHTLLNPEKIAGVIMLSPAFKIKSSFDFVLDWSHRKSWRWERANWFFIGDEIDYTKYCSITFNAVYQVYRLTQALQKLNTTEKLHCPIFIVMSYDDLMVCSLTAINYFLKYASEQSRMILYSSARHTYDDSRIIVRNSNYPDWNIINFSHISIPVSPSNFHYGMEGDFPLASHVQNHNNIIYGALDKPRKFIYDSMYKFKLLPYQRQRLTFNPDFDFMVSSIKEFIQNQHFLLGQHNNQ